MGPVITSHSFGGQTLTRQIRSSGRQRLLSFVRVLPCHGGLWPYPLLPLRPILTNAFQHAYSIASFVFPAPVTAGMCSLLPMFRTRIKFFLSFVLFIPANTPACFPFQVIRPVIRSPPSSFVASRGRIDLSIDLFYSRYSDSVLYFPLFSFLDCYLLASPIRLTLLPSSTRTLFPFPIRQPRPP